jgi:membrane carboxypeptidase/penicillin-binding protein
MGKTGTTSAFRDALFVGSTWGQEGCTVAVWIGFDDNRSLGPDETGARNALPVFAQIMRRLYDQDWMGLPPAFPDTIERSIDTYLSRSRAMAAEPSLPVQSVALEPAPPAPRIPVAPAGAPVAHEH